MTEPREATLPRWARAAQVVVFVLFVLLYGGIFAGLAFRSNLAAYVALGAFVATLAAHLVAAILNYRHVMRREWPRVEPLDDHDDW